MILKYVETFSNNYLVLFTAVHPILWGLWILALFQVKGLKKIGFLGHYGLALLTLFLLSFSMGEYEGVRFFLPVAPIVTLGGMAGLFHLLSGNKKLDPVDTEQGQPSKAVPVGLVSKKIQLTLILFILLLPGLLDLNVKALHPKGSNMQIAVQSIINSYVEEGAVVGTDIPWATGWYGQRFSIWLPLNPFDIETINQSIPIDYVIITPVVQNSDWDTTIWKKIYTSNMNPPGYQLIQENRIPWIKIYKKKE